MHPHFTHPARLAFIVPILLAWFGPFLSGDELGKAAEPTKDTFHLFLLVGQSNMAGRGKVEEADRQTHPRVLTFTKENQWAPARDPLHFDKPAMVGVGLGRTFGVRIADANPAITVGLIPCAVGGTPIATWEPGAYHASTGSHPWDDAIRRAHLALKDGTLRGILWHQGESDAQPELAEVYERKLLRLIARFRAELNAEGVPFIVGQMGQFDERPWNEAKHLVDAAHRQLPEESPATAFVSSDGLAHKGDQVHFDSPSYREFGRRYAQAYLRLMDSRKLDSTDGPKLDAPPPASEAE
jgi:hypothetical protein